MRKLSDEDYERMVQESFPHMSLCGEYTRMHSEVVMACSRCGGRFKRIALVNPRSECPICFQVYHRIYNIPQGFRDAVEALADIRDLGKGNLDYHLGAKDTPHDELAEKHRQAGRWGILLRAPDKAKSRDINALVDEVIAEFEKGL